MLTEAATHSISHRLGARSSAVTLAGQEMISVLLGEIRIPRTHVYLCVVRGCAMRPASYKHLLLDLRSAMMEENGSSGVQDLGKTKGASREKEGDNMKV